ncbi:MAG: type II secretion system F family protein [Candidatus Wildermuthbacteria bacterium]|nr:type II secretion system F family protein [Candidatus Wildermuthbacteria bacterium]
MQFTYQARDQKGDFREGVIEASSEEGALDLLHRYGLYVTGLQLESKRPVYAKDIEFFNKPSVKDVMIFSRQLAVMVRSQVPIIEALHTLASQTKKRTFKEKIMKIEEDVEGGIAFSKSLAKHKALFSSFYISMVQSGEASGKLSDVLQYLADHLEREYELTSKVRGAMIYPAFILVAVVIVVTLMVFFVIPNILQVVTEAGTTNLPLATKFVIWFTYFVQSWWWIIFGAMIGAIVALFQLKRSPAGERIYSKIKSKVPVISRMMQLTYIARFAENLATLIGAGIPIVPALEITGQVVGDVRYKEIIKSATEAVRQGESISSVLDRYPNEFPPVFTQMVYVGEQSGSLDSTLNGIVGFYRNEVNRIVDNLLTLLEPFLIIFLGLIVAGVMASILLPLYQTLTSVY